MNMAAISEELVVCNLPSEADFLGLEPSRDDNEIIVSLRTKSVTIYNIHDQKPVCGWSLKPGLVLTCPTIYNPKTEDFIAVHSKKVICICNTNQSQIDKSKKISLSSPIYKIVRCGDREPFIVFENGFVVALSQAHGLGVEQVLADGDAVHWCESVHIRGCPNVIVVSKTQMQKGNYKVYIHRFDTETGKSHYTHHTLSLQDASLHSCYCQENEENVMLISLWSNGQLCYSELSGASTELSMHLLPCIPGLGQHSAIAMLDKTHLAVLGVKKSIESTQSEGLAVWDTKFGIMKTWRALPKGSNKMPKQLHKFGRRLLVPWNKQLLCIECLIQPSTLGTMLGKCPTSQSSSSTYITAHWGKGMQQKLKKQKTESQITPLLEEMTDSKKTPSIKKFSNLFAQFEKEIESMSIPPVIPVFHMKQLLERCTAEKKTFWPKQQICQIVKLGLMPGSICGLLFTLLIEHDETQLIHECLYNIHDIPEEELIKCLQYFLRTDDSKFPSHHSTKETSIEYVDIEDTDSPFSKQKAIYLNSVFCLPYNDVFLVENLKKLDFQHVIDLLKYLNYLLVRTPTVLVAEKDTPDHPTIIKVMDWMSLLVDAHFTQLILSTDARTLLVNLHQLVSSQVHFYDELGSLEAVLSQLKEKCELPQKKNVGVYSIEVLHIY